MKRLMSMLLLLALPGLVFAHGGVDDARKSVEASMVVTGLIAVNPDGNVYGYSLDQRDKLPADVIKLIDETLPSWKFQPITVDGKPVLAKALMSLRVVAAQNPTGQYQASVAGASFGLDTAQSLHSPECANNACLTPARRTPPEYPIELVQEQVSATVYVVLKVNRQGSVENAAVRQVDLENLADETEMNRWRRAFANASLRAAHDWKFNYPTTGEEVKSDFAIVSVAINYILQGITPPQGYGQWSAYVRGPVQEIPWADADTQRTAAKGSGDAIPDDGTPVVSDQRFVLLTPFDNDDPSARRKQGTDSGS